MFMDVVDLESYVQELFNVLLIKLFNHEAYICEIFDNIQCKF